MEFNRNKRKKSNLDRTNRDRYNRNAKNIQEKENKK